MFISSDEVAFLIDVLDQYLNVLSQAMDLGLNAPKEYEERGKAFYESSAKEFSKAYDLYDKLSRILADA